MGFTNPTQAGISDFVRTGCHMAVREAGAGDSKAEWAPREFAESLLRPSLPHLSRQWSGLGVSLKPEKGSLPAAFLLCDLRRLPNCYQYS